MPYNKEIQSATLYEIDMIKARGDLMQVLSSLKLVRSDEKWGEAA